MREQDFNLRSDGIKMANSQKKKRNQRIMVAEGYLDLIFACQPLLELDDHLRIRLADKVIETLSEIDENTGRTAHIYYLAGQAHRVCERHEEAIDCFNHALEFDSNNIHIYLALGWSHKRLGDLDDAINALEIAYEIEPSSGIINYNLACYWALANNVDVCVQYLARAIDIESSYRDMIASETDFDLIRHRPEFLLATSVIV